MKKDTTIKNLGRQFDDVIEALRNIGEKGERELAKAVQRTAQLGRGIIVDTITNDIRPHSGRHRKPPQETVTDLVDTGAYRQSFVVNPKGPLAATITTQSEYAYVLEYGLRDVPVVVKPYQYVRKVKQKGKKRKVKQTIDVPAHIRVMNMKPFYVVSRSAKKIIPVFQREVSEALARAVQEGTK